MREIKFRAWDGEKLVPATTLTMFDGKVVVTGSLPWETWKDTRIIENNVMQFTGLKDKNGKEIYEGDITKNVRGNIKEVEWISEDEGCDFTGWIIDGSEVIGNIYENPELLK